MAKEEGREAQEARADQGGAMMALEWTEEARAARVAQGKRSLGMGRRTDSDAVDERAEVIELAERLGREARAATARRDGRGASKRESDEFIHALHDELRASRDGRDLGRKFQHDARVLARHLGLPVAYVPLGSLQRGQVGSTNLGVLKSYPGTIPAVELADVLNGHEAQKVLSHECAHALGFTSEQHADIFAARFMEQTDDETPAGRWRASQDELLERERQYQIARGRALAAASSF